MRLPLLLAAAALLGTTAAGEPFVFARNRQTTTPGNTGELSGVSFSPDGRVMFFNVYDPGTTFAVTGPWRRRGGRRRFHRHTPGAA